MSDNSQQELKIKCSVEHNLEDKKENELFRVTFSVGDVSQTFESTTIEGILILVSELSNK